MVTDKLKGELQRLGITLYRLSKLTNIRYELLRRTFNGKRKLSADEFMLIIEKADIDLGKIK